MKKRRLIFEAPKSPAPPIEPGTENGTDIPMDDRGLEDKEPENVDKIPDAPPAPAPEPPVPRPVPRPTPPAPAPEPERPTDLLGLSGDTTEFNIRSGDPASDFIGSFQKALYVFYTTERKAKGSDIAKIAAEEFKKKGEEKKLQDARYGYRTHCVSKAAIDSLIVLVNAAREKQKGSTNESRRVERLARLLNQKLVGTRKNWLFEDDQSVKKVSYDKLIKTLTMLKTKFTDASDNDCNTKLEEDKFIEKQYIELLMNILNMLEYDNDGNIINLEEIAKKVEEKGGGEGPPPDKKPDVLDNKPEPGPAPDKEDEDRLRDPSCWYAMNITVKGNPVTGPREIWQQVQLDFDSWFDMLKPILDSESLPDDFTYRTGFFSSTRALLETLAARRATNINLACFIQLFTPVLQHFESQMRTAQDRYETLKGTNPTAAENYLTPIKGIFLNDKGEIQGSKIYEIYRQLNLAVRQGAPQKSQLLIFGATKAKNAGNEIAADAFTAMAQGQPLPTQTASVNAPATTVGTRTSPFNNYSELENFAKQKGRTGPIEVFYKDNNEVIPVTVDPNGAITSKVTTESLKQKREALLHKALFKRLVK